MRFRQIEVFYTIMRYGSVSAAAERLGVSQPSVTKTLRQAETDLGYPLFERIKGRLHPTQEARVLFREVRRAYSTLENVRSVSRMLKSDVEGYFRVAATPALGHQILPIAVSDHFRAHRKVGFEITTQHSGELLNALGRVSHGYDLGFTFGDEGAPNGIQAFELARAPLACIAVPSILARPDRPVRFSDLDGLPFIALEETEPLGRLVNDGCRDFDVLPKAVVKVQTYQVAATLACQGVGMAIVDIFTADTIGRQKISEEIWIEPFEPERTLPVTAVYSSAQGLPAAARQFIDSFVTVLKDRGAV